MDNKTGVMKMAGPINSEQFERLTQIFSLLRAISTFRIGFADWEGDVTLVFHGYSCTIDGKMYHEQLDRIFEHQEKELTAEAARMGVTFDVR